MTQEVIYEQIPYVSKPVSRILFGTAMSPFNNGGDDDDLLDEIVSMGINTLDLARVYGHSEEVIGRWMKKRGNRDRLVLLSKCGHPDPLGRKRVNEKAMRHDFAVSSAKLATDYIDIYLLHRDDPKVPVGEIVEIFNAMHEEGKIGAFGGSNWTHARIAEANEYARNHNLIPFTVSSPNYGLADQVKDPWGGGCITISGPANADARQWYESNQMPVIAYSSLARGFFSGRLKASHPEDAAVYLDSVAQKGYAYPDNFERLRRCELLAEQRNCSVPQIAMAYIFNQKIKTFAVVSTIKASRMEENIAATHIELTPEECAWLDLRRETPV